MFRKIKLFCEKKRKSAGRKVETSENKQHKRRLFLRVRTRGDVVSRAISQHVQYYCFPSSYRRMNNRLTAIKNHLVMIRNYSYTRYAIATNRISSRSRRLRVVLRVAIKRGGDTFALASFNFSDFFLLSSTRISLTALSVALVSFAITKRNIQTERVVSCGFQTVSIKTLYRPVAVLALDY